MTNHDQLIEALVAEALTFLASDSDRLWRFLNVTGLEPATIREAAAHEGFGAAVLQYVISDEDLLLDLADFSGRQPGDYARPIGAGCPEPKREGVTDKPRVNAPSNLARMYVGVEKCE